MKSITEKFILIMNKISVLLFALFWGIVAFSGMFGWFERYYVYPLKHKEIVCECADYYSLDRALIFSVIKVESSFDNKAVSSAGAVGLMQITPRTAEYIAKLLKVTEYDLLDEYTNVWFGCFYLKYLLAKFENVQTALCAYNAGEGNVLVWLNDKEYSLDGINLDVIPYGETKEYVQKINKSYKKYTILYPNLLDKQ